MLKRMRRMTAVALLLALAVPVSLSARPTVAQKKKIALAAFEKAERMREALNGRPEKDRTLQDYRAVMDAYRRVYYVAPTSAKADDAIVAVAELLADAGRIFDSDKLLEDAIGQYEFLRKEYPGSRFRAEALFTIAEIYQDDLGDAAQARSTWEDFLKHYPQSELAQQAKEGLAELDKPAENKAVAAKSNPEKSEKTTAKETGGPPALPREAPRTAEKTDGAVQRASEDLSQSARDTQADKPSGRNALVKGVRHWSTPDYTRVAIDLDQDVQYSSDRIDNPDRIYFDLHHARLSSVLAGKSFEVDDGFLKKIRVAQFQAGETRVVLEVDGVSEYSAFLLPNPYRLIVDIHGKKPATLVAKGAAAKSPAATSKTENTDVAPTSSPAQAVNENELPKASHEPVPALRASAGEGAGAPAPKIADEDVGATTVSAAKEVAANRAPLPLHTPATRASATHASAKPPALPPGRGKAPVLPATASTKPELDPVAAARAAEMARIKNGPLPTAGKKKIISDEATHTAEPMADGDRSLIRALGLKIGRIVVDAGHGGHDTGTIGPNGLMEKDLVLDVVLRLGKLLQNRLGADVTYTRDDDTFIPLETRTAIANQKQADLFISVHANSSRDRDARGVETYYLNFTSSADALEVAARENAVSDQSIHELQDLVKKIALKEKVDESKEFAADVQQALYKGLAKGNKGIHNRGVKKAPFIVLIGANMPSILAEISFVSNPTDAKKLQTPQWRQKIAESLYEGVAKYVSGLSGLRVAADTGKKPQTEAARP